MTGREPLGKNWTIASIGSFLHYPRAPILTRIRDPIARKRKNEINQGIGT